MVLANSWEVVKYHRLFMKGVRFVMMISKIALILWLNTILKRRETALYKISSNITNEYKIEIWNALVFRSTELLPLDAIF